MNTQQGIVLTALIVVVVLLWWLYRTAKKYNHVDWGSRWFGLIDGLNRFLCFTFHRLQPHQISLPEKGGCIVVCNHVSGLDPLVLIAAARRPLRFLIAREEYERFGLQWLFRGVGCIPVERSGRPELALREALRTLQAGEVVAIFPHGKIHLDTDPPRKLKKGVAWLAAQTDAPVIPCRITGIRGLGMTLSAVFIRSRVKLEVFNMRHCGQMSGSACLDEIAQCIEGRQRAE